MNKQMFFILIVVIIANLFMTGYKKVAFIFSVILVFSIVVLIIYTPHLENRITDYYTHQGNCHQIQQCLNSFDYGSGLGIGLERTHRSLEKGNLLPSSLRHTTFAVVVEHFGIFGGIILIAFFAIIVYHGLRVYRNFNEGSDGILIVLLLLVFFMLNSAHILNCFNIFPFSSDLSFFSSGRTHFFFTMIFMGLIWKKMK